MPRYLIERKFPQGLSDPLNADGHKAIEKLSPTIPNRVLRGCNHSSPPIATRLSASTTRPAPRQSEKWLIEIACPAVSLPK